MYLEQRDLPSKVSNKMVVELWHGLVHIKAIRLTTREAASQAVQGAVGTISCTVLVSLLFYLLSHVVYPGQGARKERATSLKRFLTSDMGVILLCLFVSDLGMSLAAIGDIPWSRTFIITHSPLCNFQGVTNQFGVTAAAFWNLCLAVQTFCLLFLRYTPPTWVKWVVVPLGWTFAILMTILGPLLNESPYSFYGPNSSGCWLTIGSSNYKTWLRAVAYLSICSLAVMVILYSLIFLSLSGALEKITNRQNSSVGRGSSSGPGGKSSGNALPSSVARGRQVRSVARKMLWYPLSYLVLSIPLTVCTLLAAEGKFLDHEIYIASNMMFVLISVADVVIFVLTRHHLLASATASTRGGISMNIVTSTFNPPNQIGAQVLGSRPLPYVRSQSPVDSLESEVASYIEESSRDGHTAGTQEKNAWDPQGLPSTPKQVKRSSKAEKTARSQGHEDSFGLRNNEHYFAKIDCTDEESRSSKVTLA